MSNSRAVAAVVVAFCALWMIFAGLGCGTSETGDTIYMATWCPHSKELKQFLNDDRIRDYVAKRKIQFVFRDNEWLDVEGDLQQMAKAGRITKEEIPGILSRLKAKEHGSNVFDPSFFDGLPGPHHCQKLPSQVNSFPKVKSDGKWVETGDWITSTLGVPADLALDVINKYKAKDTASADVQ